MRFGEKAADWPLVSESITEFLLGVLPLESMDLIVDTVHHKLVGAHGDRAVYLAK